MRSSEIWSLLSPLAARSAVVTSTGCGSRETPPGGRLLQRHRPSHLTFQPLLSRVFLKWIASNKIGITSQRDNMTQTIVSPAPSVLKLMAHDLRWALLQQLTQSDYRVAELVAQVKQPLNLVSYHLRQLRQAGLVHERRSSADERSFYYSVDLQRLHMLYVEASSSLHPSLGGALPPGSRTHWHFDGPPPRLLFLCTSNSARSQMAEALVGHLSQGQVQAFSAGSHPAQAVNPLAIRALARADVPMSQSVPKSLEMFVGQSFDRVITLCDRVRERCPTWQDSPLIHWSLPDPATAEGSEAERQQVFDQLTLQLDMRIRLLLTVLEQEQREIVSGQKTVR